MEKSPKFPHSRELFRFAKQALVMAGNVPGQAPDYAVGRALGLKRDVTSRFKTGERDYALPEMIVRIERATGMDRSLLVAIAAGEIDHAGALESVRNGNYRTIQNPDGENLLKLINLSLDPSTLDEAVRAIHAVLQGQP